MVTSLESLADQIGISDEVMGVTLSAAGTSLPGVYILVLIERLVESTIEIDKFASLYRLPCSS
jgi:Ca2+/Na+ antiporter